MANIQRTLFDGWEKSQASATEAPFVLKKEDVIAALQQQIDALGKEIADKNESSRACRYFAGDYTNPSSERTQADKEADDYKRDAEELRKKKEALTRQIGRINISFDFLSGSLLAVKKPRWQK